MSFVIVEKLNHTALTMGEGGEKNPTARPGGSEEQQTFWRRANHIWIIVKRDRSSNSLALLGTEFSSFGSYYLHVVTTYYVVRVSLYGMLL
jgi:hypothetical protein